MQNNNGVKQRFLDCFLKILDKKRKRWRELQKLADGGPTQRAVTFE
jgi:hypothetical protein